MPKAIVIQSFGGPEVMRWQDVEAGPPARGEARIRQSAAGLNFIDTYHRSGLYPLQLPSGLGTEGAGIVVAVGEGVSDLAVGDRVAYAGMPVGAYAEERCFPAASLARLPDEISERTAAAAMLKGLTAWYLLKRSYPVRAGDTVLLYAAAGGVGLIAAQWAKSLGVRVIGVVSTPKKAALAREHGCAEIVMADDPDFVAHVRSMTGGKGVAAVYDSIGRTTFFQSLDCLRPHGTMVTFGNATGPVDPFSPMELARRGSLFLTRPVLFDFIRTQPELQAASDELFATISSGRVKIAINQVWPMAQAADAHRALEARQTTGSSLLLV